MKRTIAILLMLAMLVSFAGCGETPGKPEASATDTASAAQTEAAEQPSASTGQEMKKIGMVVPSLQAEFFIGLYEGIRDKMAEHGYEVTAQSYDGDNAKSLSIIENFVVSGVECIIAMVEPASDPALKYAMEQGVKVVVPGIETENYDLCLVSDNAQMGQLVAEMAADFINTVHGGKCEVIACVANTNIDLASRSNAMLETLKELAPDAQIVAQYDQTEIVVGAATAAIENYLQQYPDVKVVVSFGDQQGLEAYEVFKAAGKEAADVGIFSCDALQQTLSLVKEGGMYRGTVYMGNLVDMVVENTLRLLDGDETLEKRIVTQGVKISKDNVDEYIKPEN